MKILFLDPLKLRYKDGCDIHRIELIKNLCELQNEVYTLVKGSEKNYGNLQKLSTINITHIKNGKITTVYSYLNTLILLTIKEKLDILYTRNIIYCAFGLFFKRIRKSTLIFEVNGIVKDELNLCKEKESKTSKTNHWNLGRLNKPDIIHPNNILELIELFLIRHSDIIIAVTPLLKQYLVEKGINENKIHVIENGANTELFKPVEEKIARKQLGFNEKDNYICFVGNLAPWQGLEYLIQAAPKVLEEIQVNFIIVGDGILRGKLEEKVKELGIMNNFIFTGLIPYDSVPLYINASNICVAPFIKERNEKIGLSPLKIYEYMACEKPLISSRIPNLEFVEEQKAGLLVEPESPVELAKAIVFLLTEEKYKEMGKNSRKYINQYHSWKHISIKILEISRDIRKKKNS